MRPMAELFSATLLGGWLVAAVLLAEKLGVGSQPVAVQPPRKSLPAPTNLRIMCGGPYRDRILTSDELSAIHKNHLAWLASLASNERDPNDERRANLCGAKLQNASLFRFNLQWAYLSEVDLQKADLYETNLTGANLSKANLQGARLMGTSLGGADLSQANLARAIYEPRVESLPLIGSLISPKNHLEKLVFQNSPAGLVALREAFRKAGMRSQERQVTYAIEYSRRRQAWNPSWLSPGTMDTRPWMGKVRGKFESGVRLVAFELPSDYDMAYERPLIILGGSVVVFSLVYMAAFLGVFTTQGRAGIWATWPPDRVYKAEGPSGEGEASPSRVNSTFILPQLQAWTATRQRRIWGILL